MLALAASLLVMISVGGGGWMWALQKEEAIRRSELAQRQKLEQQINSELATATALAHFDSKSDQLPDPSMVQRALAAIDRAHDLLSTGDVDEAVTEQVESERTRLSTLQHDQKLISGLELAWQEEMEFRAEETRKLEAMRTSQDAKNSVDDIKQVS